MAQTITTPQIRQLQDRLWQAAEATPIPARTLRRYHGNKSQADPLTRTGLTGIA